MKRSCFALSCWGGENAFFTEHTWRPVLSWEAFLCFISTPWHQLGRREERDQTELRISIWCFKTLCFIKTDLWWSLITSSTHSTFPVFIICMSNVFNEDVDVVLVTENFLGIIFTSFVNLEFVSLVHVFMFMKVVLCVQVFKGFHT